MSHRRLLTRLCAVVALVLTPALAACGDDDDGRIRLTVATFGEFGYDELYREYEAANPGIRIVERVTRTEDHHKNLAAHLATNTGAADVEAVEEGWLGQFTAAPNRFVDLTAHGAGDLKDRWPEWKWTFGTSADGRVIGLGTDVGGMAMCYRRDLFGQAGLPTRRDEVAKLWPTWEKYIEAGVRFKQQMPDVAWMDGPTTMFRSILGQQEVGIYDGPDSIVVSTNPGVRTAWDLSVRALESDLSARMAAFTSDWNAGLAAGSFATLACPSWMMTLIQGQARKAAGLWDVTTVPGGGGNWGGSWLTVPKQTEHPAEAAALAIWLTAPEQQAKVFRASGNFPSTVGLYNDPVIAEYTNPFFNDAPVGRFFATSVTKLVPQYIGPRSGDVATRITAGLTRVEQGRDDPEESWRKVLREVDVLS